MLASVIDGVSLQHRRSAAQRVERLRSRLLPGRMGNSGTAPGSRPWRGSRKIAWRITATGQQAVPFAAMMTHVPMPP